MGGVRVQVVPYDPAWRDAFAEHRAVLAEALAPLSPSVDHIGSTSLGDIAAKPIIDILVGIPDASRLDDSPPLLMDAGYSYVQAFDRDMPYRRFFARLVPLHAGTPPLIIRFGDSLAFGRDYDSTVHVHVMERGCPHWVRHLAFRDYLRAHPAVRAEYEALKLEIARRDFDDPRHYNAYKEAFIVEHEANALAWISAGGIRY